jgi:hypothetical protein
MKMAGEEMNLTYKFDEYNVILLFHSIDNMRRIIKKMDRDEEQIQINFDDIEVTDSQTISVP